MTTTKKAPAKKTTTQPAPPPASPNPIWDGVLADLGELAPPVDTEYRVLEATAVMALAGKKP